jgi:hypothetical protein
MVPSLRQSFNEAWTAAGYERLLAALGRAAGTPLEFP